MESRVEQAIERHKKGYNCSQAVACTYCDLFGIDEETMFRVTEGLGAGMGNMDGTCGAVSGACVLAGLKGSTAHLTKPDSKGIDTGVVIRKCPDCVRDAATIAETVLFED